MNLITETFNFRLLVLNTHSHEQLMKQIEAKRFIMEQVFNTDEMGLF